MAALVPVSKVKALPGVLVRANGIAALEHYYDTCPVTLDAK